MTVIDYSPPTRNGCIRLIQNWTQEFPHMGVVFITVIKFTLFKSIDRVQITRSTSIKGSILRSKDYKFFPSCWGYRICSHFPFPYFDLWSFLQLFSFSLEFYML